MIRCLYRPGQETLPRSTALPIGVHKQSIEGRATLEQFLAANLAVPLHFTDQQHEARITEALETMSWAERITIEIEMQRRSAPAHSFDYDPLK